MRKTTLLLASMTLAVLLSCTTTVLMVAQGVAQTATERVTLVGAGDIAECSQDNNAEATAALLIRLARSARDYKGPHQLPLVALGGMMFQELFSRIPYEVSEVCSPLGRKFRNFPRKTA